MNINDPAKNKKTAESQLKYKECKTCNYYQAYIKNNSESELEAHLESTPTVESQAEKLYKKLVPFTEKLASSKCSYEEISKALSFTCESSAESIKDIIQKISFNGISKDIIKLYLTKEGFGDDSSVRYSQDLPDNYTIETIITSIKKDTTLLFLKEAFDTLVNYTQQEKYSKKPDIDLLWKAKQVLYFNNMTEFQNSFIDYLDSNNYLTDLKYSTISQFFENFNIRFEAEIPEICCTRYFGTLRDNLERYIISSNRRDFRLILNPSKKLESIDAVVMPKPESENFTRLQNELIELKNYLSYLKDFHSDNVYVNKSLVLYLYNNDCRLIDILFMAFLSNKYDYSEYEWNLNNRDSSFKKKLDSIIKELNEQLLSLTEEDEIMLVHQTIGNMISLFDICKDKADISDADLFCTKTTLMGHWASNDFFNPYNNNKLLCKVLLPSIREYVFQIYKKNTGIYKDIELYIKVLEELKNSELLLDYISDSIAIIESANTNFLKDYFNIRQSIYQSHYLVNRTPQKNTKK